MRPLFSALVVVVMLTTGCAARQTESNSAVGGTVDVVAVSTTSDAQTTTSEATASPCTPDQMSTSTETTAAGSTSEATTTTISTTTTTETPTTPTTTPSDPQLAAQQQRLIELGYWLGPVDGRFGSLTAHAVTAFQKAEGLPRTRELDAATVERLATATTPVPQSNTGTVLEIDLSRQILLVAVDGHVNRIYDIATGKPSTPTPPGRFQIYTQIDGYRYAPLGTLYRPKYFNGGIALHGYTSVPTEPASHGCVRLTYPAMDNLWASGAAPIGTPVWVY